MKVDRVSPETEAALAHLAAADPVMSRLISERGTLQITSTDDYFFTLLDAIASQQLSSKAAATIVNRIRTLVANAESGDSIPQVLGLPPGRQPIQASHIPHSVTPESILALPDQALRDAGLSWSKVSYVKDLAGRVASGQLDLAHIARQDDEEVIKELVAVKGIGRWTAEMFLIFSLGRPDVLAVDDYGLRAAMMRLYDLPDLPKPAPMRQMGERWRPYRSYASLYLWRSVDGSPQVQAMEVK